MWQMLLGQFFPDAKTKTLNINSKEILKIFYSTKHIWYANNLVVGCHVLDNTQATLHRFPHLLTTYHQKVYFNNLPKCFYKIPYSNKNLLQ